MKFLAAFLLIFTFVIVENSALLCYSCHMHKQEHCAADKDPPLLAAKNCDPTPKDEFAIGGRATCYKIKKSIMTDRVNETFYHDRGCTISGGKFDFCDEAYQKDPEYKCFLCHEDFCNSGHSAALELFLYGISFFIAMTFW